MISELEKLTKAIVEFNKARNWSQFHNPKDLALSLVLEASEVMEHFQWKNPEEIQAYVKKNKAVIGDELADVFYWVLLMSHYLDIDIIKASVKKLNKNKKKYPIKKAKGRHTKYNKL